jgi:hypothetical protein
VARQEKNSATVKQENKEMEISVRWKKEKPLSKLGGFVKSTSFGARGKLQLRTRQEIDRSIVYQNRR